MRRSILALFFCMAAILSAFSLIAESVPQKDTLPPPALPETTFTDLTDVHKERLALQFTLGNFTGVFEETTLDAVQKFIQSGTLRHQGDASESIYWLCYTLSSSTDPQRLWIISNGEMGGYKHSVTEITTENIEAGTNATTFCPELPGNLRPFAVDRGIGLGMSQRELLKVLGKPSKVSGEWMIYSHSGKVPPDFDEVGWLVVHLINDRAVYLSAGKTTSN